MHCFLLILCTNLWALETEDAQQMLQCLVDGCQANFDELPQFRIQYRWLRHRRAATIEDAMAGRWQADPAPADCHITWIRSGRMNRFEARYDERTIRAHTKFEGNSRIRSYVNDTYVFRDKVCIHQAGRAMAVGPTDRIFFGTLWTPFNQGMSHTFPDRVKIFPEKGWPVRYSGEMTVEGQRLALVTARIAETQLDRLFVDLNRGYIPTRIESYMGFSEKYNETNLPPLTMVHRVLEMKQFANGCWLPMHARYVHIDTNAPPTTGRQTGYEVIVDDVDLNFRPSNEAFRLETLPPTVFRNDFDGKIYKVNGRISLSDFNDDGTLTPGVQQIVPVHHSAPPIVAAQTEQSHTGVPSWPFAPTAPTPKWKGPLVIALAIAGGLVLCFSLRKMRSVKR